MLITTFLYFYIRQTNCPSNVYYGGWLTGGARVAVAVAVASRGVVVFVIAREKDYRKK